MGEINWTAEAERWMRDIHDYIALDSPAAAQRVLEGIYSKAQLLSRFPEIGYKYHGPAGRDIRILLHGHYRIAYLVKSEGQIEILGVFHGALDIDRHLL